MGFEVAAQAYGRFMGRYAEPLADEFVAVADLRPGQRALDVGCGPGALTARLTDLLGVPAVVAVEPSAAFVAAVTERLPGLEVTRARAEQLPFADDSFDASLAQLVVHFMSNPVAGLREMARVTRPGGVVAACVWDHAGGQGPLSTFWAAVAEVDPAAVTESDLPGSREGHLVELARAAGLGDVTGSVLTVRVPYRGFDEWWEPYLLGVGPAGDYLAGAADVVRDEVRERCRRMLPAGAFEATARAWCVRGSATGG